MAGTGSSTGGESKSHHDGTAAGVITLLVVGETGTGKSATGNSILGREAFASRRSFSSVTLACHTASSGATLHAGGRRINVIDTPGLVDTTGGAATEDDGRGRVREIIECMGMVKDGIHAVLVVLSAASRFSPRDAGAVETMKELFGDRMILVFTHGDTVADEAQFRDLLGSTAPDYMLEMVKMCGGRVALFDNVTEDARIQERQREELLGMVGSIVMDRHQRQTISGHVHRQIKVEEGVGEEEKLGIKGHSEVQESRAKNGICHCQPWYIKALNYLACAFEVAWDKICRFFREMAADKAWAAKEAAQQQKEVAAAGTVVWAYRRMLRPRVLTDYHRHTNQAWRQNQY